MSFRRKPNPNRNHPQYCPYCAGEDLYPDEETEFAWACQECARVFSVMFHGQNAPKHTPAQSLSTNDALRASLERSKAGSDDIAEDTGNAS